MCNIQTAPNEISCQETQRNVVFYCAVAKLHPAFSESVVSIASSSRLRRLIQGSFSQRTFARQYPIISGAHRAIDGALLGVLVAVLMMSAFSLHWRHRWTIAYAQLETTRDLTHKLKFSTAMLEQHLLKRSRLPLSMVRTNAEKLYYLDNPELFSSSDKSHSLSKHNFFRKIVSYPIKYGY